MYLLISKGTAPAEDVNENAHHQQTQYQQPAENYPTQQYNNYTQQPCQGQYNTNKPHTYQQQQSYPQAQNNYNQFGIHNLPPPEPVHQCTNCTAPQMTAGGKLKQMINMYKCLHQKLW